LASEKIVKADRPPVCAVGRAALMSAPTKECTPASIPMSLIALVLFPGCLAQPGAVEVLGTVGVYILSVFWCFAGLSLYARLSGSRFCGLAAIWFVLACAGGAALYYWPG
jgi:uncharacterized membrane protein YecN with MAPEG domain